MAKKVSIQLFNYHKQVFGILSAKMVKRFPAHSIYEIKERISTRFSDNALIKIMEEGFENALRAETVANDIANKI